jgi:hypothetical protein
MRENRRTTFAGIGELGELSGAFSDAFSGAFSDAFSGAAADDWSASCEGAVSAAHPVMAMEQMTPIANAIRCLFIESSQFGHRGTPVRLPPNLTRESKVRSQLQR